ncbi:uncharacterized protein LOC116261432 isoform X2 [Nymphaea colorata]|uniref:uncharacterized protein LOC116261432 isoform X2 n=1 Tax=Nymphaea colorata TaxID=210225 RepID=UPI00129D4F66|nr:uncharacterized protein LOC116261432 isoform X2 [Nymphaea colorata]
MSARMSTLAPLLLLLYFSFHSVHALTPINRDLYHISDGLIAEIKGLVRRHPESLDLETWRARNKGYSAKIFVVTYRHRGWKTNDDDDHKYRIILSFGQHGRELITSEVALRLLKILCGEHEMPSILSDSLNHSFDNLVIKVIPMENLNGRKLVEAGDLCERRNGRGVDLNRNWSVDWGKKEKALFMPYDHRNTTPEGHTSQIMRTLLDDLNHLHCKDHCMVGSGGGSVGYLAHGTSTDYIYDVIKVPMVFTFEIYGDSKASSKDCFKMFNPTDSFSFERVLDDWASAFLRVFVNGPRLLQQKGMTAGGARDKGILEIDSMQDLLGQEISTYRNVYLVPFVVLILILCSRLKCKRMPR